MSFINILLGFVYTLNAYGAITPPMAEYITRGIKMAEKDSADLIIIKLDTPGGLDASMRDIVKTELDSKVPICVYVYPNGARAASAGAFIFLAAHITGMTPASSVGAAHPVVMQGKLDSIMNKKLVNYASSYIKSIARTRHRNEHIAAQMVEKSLSLSSEEAIKMHIADYIAPSLDSLLSLINNKKIEVNGKEVKLVVKNDRIKPIRMTLREKLLLVLSSPNVAYILMMIGIYGLLFELSHPGAIFPGVIGAISLILAFYSYRTIPVNYAGILLIILGIFFFILDIKIPSHGLLSLSGLVSIGTGSFLMFKGNAPFFTVSLWSIGIVLLFTSIFFLWIVAKAVETIRKRPVSGKEGLIGLCGIAKEDINTKKGMVQVHGELWQARSKEPIQKGDKIEVIGIEGFVLFVKKLEES